MKAILGLAGKLRHDNKKTEAGVGISEAAIVVKALTSSLLSKLIFQDSRRFSLLILDLFPETKIERIIYKELETAVKESCKQLGLIFIQEQVHKVFQLYEACSRIQLRQHDQATSGAKR